MPTYVVKPGFTFGAGGRYGEGELVELTLVEATGFLDKLELADDPDVGQVPYVDDVDPGVGSKKGEFWPAGLSAKTLRLLRKGGYMVPFDVQSATDEKLRAIVGIGQSTVDDIRAAFEGWTNE